MKERPSGKHNIDNISKHSFFSGTGSWSFPEFKVQNTIPVQVVIQEPSSHEKEMLAVGGRKTTQRKESGSQGEAPHLPGTHALSFLTL